MQLLFAFQYHILLENVEDAVKDFEKSVNLSPTFAVAHVQKCYTGNFLYLFLKVILCCFVSLSNFLLYSLALLTTVIH